MDTHTPDTRVHESRTRTIVLAALVSAVTAVLTVSVMRMSALDTTIPALTSNPSPLLPYSGAESIDRIPDMVASATPAVVSVVISADVPVIERYFEEYDPFGGMFGGFGFQIPRERRVGTEKQEVGGGTGFFVSASGYLITNKHVVDTEGATFSVVTNDGETFDVEVIAKDPTLDVAILKVKGDHEPFPYLALGESTSVRLGETVVAIGNALAEFPNTVSVGVISGLSRDIVARDLFGSAESLEGVMQTDAAINQGNSGGPLLNVHGEVIGVNVARAGGSENIGFALPIDAVRAVYESVIEFGEIVRPYIGVRYVPITKALVEKNKLDVEYGILVQRGDTREDLAVIPSSPADKAGIEENDIILEIDGVKITEDKNFASLIRARAVGDTVTLRVLHDGEERDVAVKLEKAPTD